MYFPAIKYGESFEMPLKTVLYILAIMIFYDLSIHLLYMAGFEQFFLKRKINYWPELHGKKYQVFWAAYWGIAFIIILIYLFR